MVRPCVARGSSIWWYAVLHQCIRSLVGAVLLRTIMDISARATSLTDRPRRAIGVTSVRMRREDRTSISTHPLADLGWKLLIGLRRRLLLISRSSFVRAKPFLRPGPQNVDRVVRRGGQGRPSCLACGWLR